MKGLGRLGKGQARLLWVSSMSEHACREWDGPTGAQESWDPQMHATPLVSLETLLCSRPWPGLCREFRVEPDSPPQVFTESAGEMDPFTVCGPTANPSIAPMLSGPQLKLHIRITCGASEP